MRARMTGLILVFALSLGLLSVGPASAAGAAWAGPAGAGPGAKPKAPGVQTILSQPGNAFIDTTTSGNSAMSGHFTQFDEAALNETPGVGLFAINQINAYGSGSGGYDHPVGLFYNFSLKRWGLYAEDNGTFPAGLNWNVSEPAQDLLLITHTSTHTNTVGSRTYISSTYFNDDPNALVFVQHAIDPPPLPSLTAPAGGNIFTHTVAVVYDNSVGQWAIMSADGAPIPSGITFFALNANANTMVSFMQVTSAANHLHPAATALDNPAINNNPDALLYVTQNHGTDLVSPAFNHRVGVQYDSGSGHWLIVNEDGSSMANGITFNVMVIPSTTGFLLHTATAANTIDFATRIDNPNLNFNPGARVFVSHNWNPPEDPNDIFNNHPIGVGYNGIGWSIYNLDDSPIPTGTTYNVYYNLPRGNAFDVSAGNLTASGAVMTITHPLLDQHPGAVAIANFNVNPNNAGSNFTFSYTVGLAYDNLNQKWTLSDDVAATFPVSTSYNLLVPPSNTFVVTATGNLPDTDGNDLYLDNPLTNNDPLAMVFATPRNNGAMDDSPIGVWYYDALHKWSIFNEGNQPITANESFNVFVVKRTYLYFPFVR